MLPLFSPSIQKPYEYLRDQIKASLASLSSSHPCRVGFLIRKPGVVRDTPQAGIQLIPTLYQEPALCYTPAPYITKFISSPTFINGGIIMEGFGVGLVDNVPTIYAYDPRFPQINTPFDLLTESISNALTPAGHLTVTISVLHDNRLLCPDEEDVEALCFIPHYAMAFSHVMVKCRKVLRVETISPYLSLVLANTAIGDLCIVVSHPERK